jgi:hypothetical protein
MTIRIIKRASFSRKTQETRLPLYGRQAEMRARRFEPSLIKSAPSLIGPHLKSVSRASPGSAPHRGVNGRGLEAGGRGSVRKRPCNEPHHRVRSARRRVYTG